MKNPYLEYLEKKYGETLYKDLLGIDSMETSLALFQDRRACTSKYSWAIPNQAAIETLVSLGSIIEIGAGNGYWASLIKSQGGEIEAFDSHPWLYPYIEVKEGSVEVLKTTKANTLFLCWPPYDEPLAYDALKAFKGEFLVYVGEGDGGCTGDDNFHKELKNWQKIKEVKIPSYPGIRDRLFVYQRGFSNPIKNNKIWE